MGVVSGIVMSFQFGTNWAVLSEAAGNILGPLLSYEVLTAFFLEASFLGVMLFGWKRVSATAAAFLRHLHGRARHADLDVLDHLAPTAGCRRRRATRIVDGRVRSRRTGGRSCSIPSFPYRLAHMVLAAFITTCFVIGGVGAWYLRRGVHVAAAHADAASMAVGVRRDRGAAADPRRRPARPERRANTSR